jgi:hypothetical protein
MENAKWEKSVGSLTVLVYHKPIICEKLSL